MQQKKFHEIVHTDNDKQKPIDSKDSNEDFDMEVIKDMDDEFEEIQFHEVFLNYDGKLNV